jgi:hypothetical protein
MESLSSTRNHRFVKVGVQEKKKKEGKSAGRSRPKKDREQIPKPIPD